MAISSHSGFCQLCTHSLSSLFFGMSQLTAQLLSRKSHSVNTLEEGELKNGASGLLYHPLNKREEKRHLSPVLSSVSSSRRPSQRGCTASQAEGTQRTLPASCGSFSLEETHHHPVKLTRKVLVRKLGHSQASVSCPRALKVQSVWWPRFLNVIFQSLDIMLGCGEFLIRLNSVPSCA